jgi:iron complex outermembrane recepter protein
VNNAKFSLYRRALCASSVFVTAAAIAVPAFAQEQEAEVSVEDVIIVTGSRIASPVDVSTAPLQIVNDQAIKDSGATNIQELLLENPAFGTPALSRTNSAFLTSGTGVATVDLRDLGSDRTLVLVNGRRVVAGLPGSATVDLNVIPTQFLERVDVLTGGASSLYGSDAVAGVVNFVYKRNFEGIEANGQYGITERGDDRRYQANVTVGTNFADDRGNIMVHFGYSKEGGVLSRQRKNTYLDDASVGAFITGDMADWGTAIEPFLSSFPPQGRFIIPDDPNVAGNQGSTFTYDANGQLRPCFSTNGGTAPATCGAFAGQPIGPDGFNRQAFRTIAVPVQRYLFAAAGHYEFTEGTNFFFEGTFNRTESSRIIEPFALESGGTTGIFPGSGLMPIEHRVLDGQGNVAIVQNPLVPQAIFDAARDNDGDGLRDIGFARRLAEVGNRTGSTSRDFFRFVVGFDGTVFDDRFNWDVSYNYSKTIENQVSSGQVNVANFRDGLSVMVDVDDVNGNGSTTDYVCTNAEARANGCVPVNIFGAGNISPEALAYIDAQGTFQTEITQQVVQANLSGELFNLPAGPVGIATGVEYRKEKSKEDNDALTNAGMNAGNKIPDTAGSFDVAEAYLEVRVPILADTPGFKLLDIGGSVRVADYSTVGTVYSYAGTATWKPVDDIRFRGTYSRAVRAPNIGELYSGLSQTFPSGINDPCDGVGPTGGGTAGDICRSQPGVNANIAANGVFTLNQADQQGISGFNGGNPDLEEEKADSWTLGAVITPRSLGLNNLSLSIDYYNINVKNVIAAPGRGFTLDQCFNKGNAAFCDLVTRRPSATAVNSSGSIEFIDAININGASWKTEGLDVVLNYRTGLDAIGAGGTVSAQVAYTHVFKNDYFPAAGEPADRQAGEIGTAKDRFTANLAYNAESGMRASLTGTYIGKSYEDDQFCFAYGYDAKCVGVSAEFYLDAQLGWNIGDNFELYFGVDNLLDNNAPRILTGTTFNVTGTDTAADVYDVFGRRYYTGVRLKF